MLHTAQAPAPEQVSAPGPAPRESSAPGVPQDESDIPDAERTQFLSAAQLDRLVDGEIEGHEYQALLKALESTPGGWRTF